jgi:hypothetical protein
MGFGSCTVPIFSCPAPALGLGGPYFLPQRGPNPNLNITRNGSNGRQAVHRFRIALQLSDRAWATDLNPDMITLRLASCFAGDESGAEMYHFCRQGGFSKA